MDCDTPMDNIPLQSPGNGNVLIDVGNRSSDHDEFKTRATSMENAGSPPAYPADTVASPAVPVNIITINVSGLKFQTHVETLERFPNTLLGNPVKRGQYYNQKLGEYFFDRHRSSFDAILYYYQSQGKRLKRPPTVPLDIFVSELKHFEMGDDVIKKLWAAEGYVQPKEAPLPKNHIQRQVWLTMEHPDSSLLARILAFFSVFVIVISTMSFCLETIPDLKWERRGASHNHEGANVSSSTNGAVAAENLDSSFDNPFFVVEFSCMCWFTLEFLLRFISSPSKVEFSKSFLNIIDFVAIVPFFVNLAMAGAKPGGTPPFAVLRVFRLVRVFRIFKLSRHSRGLQILGKTFKASIQELCLLVFFLSLGLVLFSSAIYIAENLYPNPNTKFVSIPASFWYVIITMTTVGYGDMAPEGAWGKLVGGTCAIMGVLVLALPVPVIVANFKHYYKQERHLARMRAIESDAAADEEYCDDDDSRSS